MGQGRTVAVFGWRHGANAVAAIGALREFTDLSLSEAKALVEARLAGETVLAQARTNSGADQLISALEECGFDARQDIDGTARA